MLKPKRKPFLESKARLRQARLAKAKAKPLRSRKRKVKVVFQCLHAAPAFEGGWSGLLARHFKAWLEHKGLQDLFEVKNAGFFQHHDIHYAENTPREWENRLRRADWVVSMASPAWVKKFKGYPLGPSIKGLPKGVKPIYVAQEPKYQGLTPFRLNKAMDLLFEDLLKKSKRKFRLIKPKSV